MKVKDTRQPAFVKFHTLKIGDVFKADDDFFMKTNRIYTFTTGVLANSINLITGHSTCYEDLAEVEKVTAALVIE